MKLFRKNNILFKLIIALCIVFSVFSCCGSTNIKVMALSESEKTEHQNKHKKETPKDTKKETSNNGNTTTYTYADGCQKIETQLDASVTGTATATVTWKYNDDSTSVKAGSGTAETVETETDASYDIGGTLLKQLAQLIDGIADIVMGALNKFMLGAKGFTSAMLPKTTPNLDNSDSWIYAGNVKDEDVDFEFGDGSIDTSELIFWEDSYKIPNFLYSPEAIFSNNIAALDVNFLNPNKYNAVLNTNEAENAAKSGAGENGLRQIIADWYISFRNIAIIGLLSVLVYLGIRIIISSTAADKAKYKENLQNWVVALCLVFFIHFIMSGLMMITDQINNLFADTVNNGIVVKVDSDNIKFKTNLIGYTRFSAQSSNTYDAIAYSILYVILVIYTCVFTVMYFKRFLYMAFLTMIAPLVALTYPIDKVGDGKAQAFNMWFKEYVMHLILQPVHLILYVSLVSSAMDLVKNNLIYGIVAIAFLIPAEKLIKDMFGLNKATTTSGFGSFAGGALAMTGFKNFASFVGGGKAKGKLDKGGSSSSEGYSNKIRMQNRSFLQSFDGGSSGGQNSSTVLPGNQPSNNPENQPQNNPGSQPQNNPGDQSQNNPGDQSQNNPGNQSQNIPGGQPQNNSGGQPQNTPGGQPQNTPRGQIPSNTGNPQNNRAMTRRNVLNKARTIGGKAWKVAKPVAGLTARGLGIAGGAMIGLAAGAATGDLSKAATFMSAGALAGNKIADAGINTAGRLEKFVGNKAEDLQYKWDKSRHGIKDASAMADTRRNEKIFNEKRQNKEEKKKYEEMAGRISQKVGRDIDSKQLMELGFDYEEANITDAAQIERGLTMEMKHSDNANIHNNMIDIVGMTKDYGKDYVVDEKKRNTMQNMIKSSVDGEENQNNVWDLYTETLGMERIGRQHRINPPRQPNPTPQQPNPAPRAPRTQTPPTQPNP